MSVTPSYIFKRTLKSLNRREEIILAVFLLIALISGFFTYQNLGFSIRNNLGFFIDDAVRESTKPTMYIEGLVGEIKRLNPLFVDMNNVDRDISALIFSGLSKYDTKSKKFTSDLATHTLSADKKVYTFKIKEGIKWHDGTALSVNDVYFTYHDLIQHPDFNNPVLKANFQDITIKLKGDREIEFILKQPNSFFYSTTTIGILPRHLLKDIEVANLYRAEFNTIPIGSGPYLVKEPYKIFGESSSQVILERFNQYYGNKPQITSIKFTTYENLETMIKARSVLNGIPKINLEVPLQTLIQDEKFKIFKYTLPRYTGLFFNTDAKFLSQKKVRLALAKAIDKDELIKQIPNTRRVDTPLLELNQDDWLFRYNLEEAKGALYDAGWPLSDENSYQRKNVDGDILTLKVLAKVFSTPQKDDEIGKVLDYLINAWKGIGVKTEIELLSDPDFSARVMERNYDILLFGQDLGYNLDTFSYWHSTQKGKEGLNLSNYTSPRADSLIETIRNLFDNEDDKIKLQKLWLLQKEISEDVPMVVLYTPIYYFAIDKNIENVEISNLMFPADRFSRIYEWVFAE